MKYLTNPSNGQTTFQSKIIKIRLKTEKKTVIRSLLNDFDRLSAPIPILISNHYSEYSNVQFIYHTNTDDGTLSVMKYLENWTKSTSPLG